MSALSVHHEPPTMDADINRSDLIEVLSYLRFKHEDALQAVQLDRGVRDFLVRILREAVSAATVRRGHLHSVQRWRPGEVFCSALRMR